MSLTGWPHFLSAPFVGAVTYLSPWIRSRCRSWSRRNADAAWEKGRGRRWIGTRAPLRSDSQIYGHRADPVLAAACEVDEAALRVGAEELPPYPFPDVEPLPSPISGRGLGGGG